MYSWAFLLWEEFQQPGILDGSRGRVCQYFPLAQCSVALSSRTPEWLAFASLMCRFQVLTCQMDKCQQHGSGVNPSWKALCVDSFKARYNAIGSPKLEIKIETELKMESPESHKLYVMPHSFYGCTGHHCFLYHQQKNKSQWLIKNPQALSLCSNSHTPYQVNFSKN